MFLNLDHQCCCIKNIYNIHIRLNCVKSLKYLNEPDNCIITSPTLLLSKLKPLIP